MNFTLHYQYQMHTKGKGPKFQNFMWRSNVYFTVCSPKYLSDDFVDVPVVVVPAKVVLLLGVFGQLRDYLHPLLGGRRPPTRQLLPAQVPRRPALQQLLPEK